MSCSKRKRMKIWTHQSAALVHLSNLCPRCFFQTKKERDHSYQSRHIVERLLQKVFHLQKTGRHPA